MQYFPFAKGVPFKIRKNVIIPELKTQDWLSVFSKKIIIINNKELVKNVITLSFIEAIKSIHRNTEIEVVTKYPEIYKYQNLAKISKYEISDKILKRYTTPIFFNKSNDILIINTQYNCNTIHDIYGKHIRSSNYCFCKQQTQNLLIPWTTDYLPKIRSDLHINNTINNYILIIPDSLPYSLKCNHNNFKWSNQDVKSFCAMVKSVGITPIIMSPITYYGFPVKQVDYSLASLIYYLQNANYVLSTDYDYLFIAAFLGSSKIIYKYYNGNFTDIEHNFNIIGIENKVLTLDELTPLKVFERITSANHSDDCYV